MPTEPTEPIGQVGHPFNGDNVTIGPPTRARVALGQVDIINLPNRTAYARGGGTMGKVTLSPCQKDRLRARGWHGLGSTKS